MNAYSTREIGGFNPAGLPCKHSATPAWSRSFLGWLGKALRYELTRLVAVICITLVGTSVAAAQERIALLLGAEKYQHFAPSKISVAQNKVLEQALREQGFNVTLVADPVNAAARAALSEFSRAAETAEFALIVATGHFATYRSQSFFLPVNARIRRATDLFSRGLSVANIADIARRAKSGAFLMLMTVPDIPSTVAGVGTQPGFSTPPPANVVAVFSTSNKVPTSRVASVSFQAMKDVIEVASEKPMTLNALANSAAAGGVGRIIGDVKELNLSEPLTEPEPEKPDPAVQAEALKNAERKAQLDAQARVKEAEERARVVAQERVKEAEERARLAAQERVREAEERAQLAAQARVKELEERARLAEQRAREAEEKAKRDFEARRRAEEKARRDLAAAASAAERRAAEAKRTAEENAKRELAAVAAEAERKAEDARRAEAARKAAEERAAARTEPASPAAEAPTDAAPNIQSLQVVEALLGRGQRRVIQRILKSKGYYQGSIDAIFGEMTRTAIRAFQRDLGATETGYLTPEQFQQLVASR